MPKPRRLPPRLLGAGFALAGAAGATGAHAVVSEEELRARDAAAEERRVANLAKLAPDAVASFRAGSQALAEERFEEAERLLAEAHHEVPGFTVATERLCRAKAALGQRAAALELCREAAGDESADSLAALARVLVDAVEPSPAEVGEAADAALRAVGRDPRSWRAHEARCAVAPLARDLDGMRRCAEALTIHGSAASAARAQIARGWLLLELVDSAEPDPVLLDEAAFVARSAERLVPGSSEPAQLLAAVALERNDMRGLRGAVDELVRVAPDDARTHRFAAVLALAEGDLDRAEREIERARATGLGPAELEVLQRQLDEARPFHAAWLGYLGAGLGAVVGAALLLVGAALALSRATLAGRGARAVYRAVLRSVWVGYHAVLALVVAVVAAVAAALALQLALAGSLMSPRHFAVVAAGALAAVAGVAMARFSRVVAPDHGIELELDAHPALREVLVRVASTMGVRAVDTVRLTPGGELEILDHRGERRLYLGAALLEGLTVTQLEALLAHEHAHFVDDRETAGGSFALALRRRLDLARAQATFLRRLLVSAFRWLFLRMSHGACRLQEDVADRRAAQAYGSRALAAALRQAAERRVRFEAHLEAVVADVRAHDGALANLYHHRPERAPDEAAVADALASALDDEAPWASHRALADRIARIEADAPGGRGLSDEAAWTLFSDKGRLEQALTDEVRLELANERGMSIAREVRA